jgi:hypothetical protein
MKNNIKNYFYKFIYAFILLSVTFIISCEKENKEEDLGNFISGIYPEKFKDFYINIMSYELSNNSKLIPVDTLSEIFNENSINNIPFSQKEFQNTKNTEVFSMIKLSYKALNYFAFFKNMEIFFIDKQESYLLIEYPVDYSARCKMLIIAQKKSLPMFSEENYSKSFFVKWSTRPAFSYIKSKHKKIKTKEKSIPVYTWGINITTDTITTNLSLKNIKQLYPDFEGKYLFKKYDSIVVDYSYINNFELFFKKIKFFE